MANHPSDDDKYIIIGIKEKNGIASEFYNIEELIDEATYQQYIDSNIEPKIKFEYKAFNYNDCQLAYFRIYGNKDRPYLIKKTVQNSIENNKIEFREGDGFIKIGTSTNKLTRSDFDNIYKTKYKAQDRKDELVITPYWGITENKELKLLKLKYFDIAIENTSTHSIDFDVEMNVFFGIGIKIISESTLVKELNKQKKQEIGIFGITMPNISEIMPYNFHIHVVERANSVSIKRTKLRNEKTAINIPQKSVEKDIFQQELLIIAEGSYSISAEIIIRSDDFTEGTLTKKIELKIDD